jgi:GntR family transcriptional regulator of vanillate catabolism
MPNDIAASRNKPSALTRLREMILRGTLKPGERLREVELAERLSMSRTPIRQALPALAQEGLLVPAGGRGYAVRAFTRAESLQALHLRGTLEGYAAQRIVLGGGGPAIAEALAPYVAAIDELLARPNLSDLMEERYGELNERFHAIVVDGAGDALLRDLVARCNVVPFTSPRVVAFEANEDAMILALLRYAQRQHHAILDALRTGDATRAEMLFREHVLTQESGMITSAALGQLP